MCYFQAIVEQSILFLIPFPLTVLTTVLNRRQAVPDNPAIYESMCLAGCPETHDPLVPQAQAGLTHHPPVPGVQVPIQTWTPSPHILSPRLSVVQGPPPPPLPISRSGKSRIHDKRETSLPCAHTQVCTRDNKSVTCP